MQWSAHESHKTYWQVIIGLFILLTALISGNCNWYDRGFFFAWADYIGKNGVGMAYHAPGYNYPPLISYPFWLFAKFQGTTDSLNRYFHYLKIFALVFDFAGVILIIRWLARKKYNPAYIMLLLANPLFIYNSYCWGQYDAVFSAFVLFSVYSIVINRPVAALAFFTLAINFKVQSIIFIPLVGLLLIWKLTTEWTLKQIAVALCVAVLLQGLILIPFIQAKEVGHIAQVMLSAVDYFPVVSMDAFNFWSFFIAGAHHRVPDACIFILGLSYKQAGLILFCSVSFLVLFPMLYGLIGNFLKRLHFEMNTELILLVFALVPLLFFYFNTQMHERYSHPALFFIAGYCIYKRQFYMLALVLLAYGLNQELIVRFFNFSNYSTFIFQPIVSASLYTIVIALAFWHYYHAIRKAYQYER